MSRVLIAAGALLVLTGAVLVAFGPLESGPGDGCERPARLDSGVLPGRENVHSWPPAERFARPVSDAKPVRTFATTGSRMSLATARARSSAALLLSLAAGLAAAPPNAAARGQQAQRAGDFVDSIGVNVHLGYTDTPYGRRGAIARKLEQLGVGHVRDGLSLGRPELYAAWRSLAKRGIKTQLIAGDPQHRWGTGPVEDQLGVVKQELLGAVSALEGPNEYDNQGDPNWPTVLRHYQRCLYDEVKADSALRRLPVVGPSFVHSDSRGRLGPMAGDLDYGNMHPYPGGRAPDLDEHMGSELRLARLVSGDEPLIASESGYNNALRSSSTHRPVPEDVAATYMPRLYLDYFRRGIARTFAYELVDERPDPAKRQIEASFGLLRSDLSEKPAFRALEQLIALFEDPGPNFAPGRLDYAIRGEGDVRHLLLQKRDGSFYIALWRPVSVWDHDASSRREPGGRPVRLAFGSPVERLEIHRPDGARAARGRRTRASSLELRASAEVTVVRVVPGEAGRARRRSLRRLTPYERRVVRKLQRLRKAKPLTRRLARRVNRLERRLHRRLKAIGRTARRRSWQRRHMRTRYLVLKSVLRA